VHGADAFYGDLVVVDRSGNAHALTLPAALVLRKTGSDGMTVCFAELADPSLSEADFAARRSPPRASRLRRNPLRSLPHARETAFRRAPRKCGRRGGSGCLARHFQLVSPAPGERVGLAVRASGT